MIYLIVFIIVLLVIWSIARKRKKLTFDCITLIVGGVKCGKTTFQVYNALKEIKKRKRKWKFKKLFYKLLQKEFNDEEPLLYSNIPLKTDYVPISTDLLERQKRFNFKSVILLSETSLIADSMTIKDKDLNERLNLFYKLIGHETHGGSVFVETQNPSDNHYSLKRCIARFIYIHHLTKWVPFFLIFKVREMAYLDGMNIENNVNEDLDETMKWIIIPKRIWKKFDAYCYSELTDNLESSVNLVDGSELESLKANEIVTFRKENVKKGVVNK